MMDALALPVLVRYFCVSLPGSTLTEAIISHSAKLSTELQVLTNNPTRVPLSLKWHDDCERILVCNWTPSFISLLRLPLSPDKGGENQGLGSLAGGERSGRRM